MRLVPVFVLGMHGRTNCRGWSGFARTDNASSSTKTAIVKTQAKLIESLQIGLNVNFKQYEPKVTFYLVNPGSKIP